MLFTPNNSEPRQSFIGISFFIICEANQNYNPTITKLYGFSGMLITLLYLTADKIYKIWAEFRQIGILPMFESLANNYSLHLIGHHPSCVSFLSGERSMPTDCFCQ